MKVGQMELFAINSQTSLKVSRIEDDKFILAIYNADMETVMKSPRLHPVASTFFDKIFANGIASALRTR